MGFTTDGREKGLFFQINLFREFDKERTRSLLDIDQEEFEGKRIRFTYLWTFFISVYRC